MTTLKKTLLLSAFVAAGSGTAQAQFNIPGETDSIGEHIQTQRFVIRYKANAKANAMAEVAKGKGKIKAASDDLNMVAAVMSKKHALSLKNHPGIESIEVDPKRYLMAEETPYGIGMVQAGQLSDVGTGNQKICIMDTGYDRTHVDLQAVRVTGNHNSRTGAWYTDGDGHGTHVAGTIAALGGNNEGVVGVIPGNKLNLHIIKVFNNSGEWAYGSDLALAVDQCIKAGSTVISMSLGGEGSSAAEAAAFDKAKQAGLISIAAAGNDGVRTLNYPASYDSVISVAAVNSAGARPNWSQFNNKVEISAPGVDVKSTIPGNKYDSFSGTSMATPHVSGVAALVWSHYPNCSNEDIRAALNASAQDKGAAGRDVYYGHGIVKAKAAFDHLKQGCSGDGSGGTGGGGTTTPDNVLKNGVAVTGLSGVASDRLAYTITVPAGATDLNFKMTGNGDADMYVRAGAAPTLTTYDCRPYEDGSAETCTFATPQATTYHVMINGYTSFSNVSLTASYKDASAVVENQPPVSRWWKRCDGLECRFVGQRSSDPDGEIVNYLWRFEAGEFSWEKNTTHRYSAPGTYNAFLRVKDDDGAIHRRWSKVTVTNTSTSGVNVSAVHSDSETPNDVDLSWNGIEGKEVDIYMNGYLTDFTKNDGQWKDSHFAGSKGTHRYKVCEYGNQNKCSNELKIDLE